MQALSKWVHACSIAQSSPTLWPHGLAETIWYWHKNWHLDQQDRTERSEINLHAYGQFTYKKGGIYNKEKTVLSISGAGKASQLHVKEWNQNIFSHIQKLTQWIKDLNVRLETIKLIEGNISRTLFDITHSNIFLYLSPKAKETKAKINKWDLIQLQGFCTEKKNIQKMTVLFTDEETEAQRMKELFHGHIDRKWKGWDWKYVKYASTLNFKTVQCDAQIFNNTN